MGEAVPKLERVLVAQAELRSLRGFADKQGIARYSIKRGNVTIGSLVLDQCAMKKWPGRANLIIYNRP